MACACLFALLAAGAPRIALIVLWLFTPLVKNAFESAIVVPLADIAGRIPLPPQDLGEAHRLAPRGSHLAARDLHLLDALLEEVEVGRRQVPKVDFRECQ